MCQSRRLRMIRYKKRFSLCILLFMMFLTIFPLSLSSDEIPSIREEDIETLPAKENQGSVIVPGDANADGALNFQDKILIADQILGLLVAPGNPDYNQNGSVSVADVVGITSALGSSRIITLPGGVRMVFTKIPSGYFKMGADDEGWSNTMEKPVHTVNINYTFYMGIYEVTKAQWRALMNPELKGDDTAAEGLSWNDCQDFIEKMNQLGYGSFRLPSEAEWEYCCRAGTQTRFHFGNSDCSPSVCEVCKLDDYAWWCGNNSPYGTKTVGEKNPNQFGLYDMMGNVWEWCQDIWHASYTDAPADGSPWEDDSSQYRILRGGYWDSSAKNCRPASRRRAWPDARDEVTGFRLVQKLNE